MISTPVAGLMAGRVSKFNYLNTIEVPDSFNIQCRWYLYYTYVYLLPGATAFNW